MTIMSIQYGCGNITTSYEIKYGNDVVDMMFDSHNEETLNPCDCVEYLNEYGDMVKVCYKKQFHISFLP